MTFLDQISMSKIIRLKSLFDKILHSLMFSSRSKIIFSDQYNYVLCIGSRFIQWLYRFGAILQFTVNTERIFTLQFYISPKIMYCLLVTKKKRSCKLGNFWIYFKEQKEMWLYTLYINVFYAYECHFSGLHLPREFRKMDKQLTMWVSVLIY